MILVIGGRCSGKKDYVLSLGYKEEDITTDIDEKKPIMYRLEMADLPIDEELLSDREVVICDEVGNGIVPFLETQRQRREEIGSLLNSLGKKADSVIRIIAGIPIKLK